MTVTDNVGIHYHWKVQPFKSYEPRNLFFSNGMQTGGVTFP